MSTPPELAARIRSVSDMMAVRTDWKSGLDAIAAELEQQPQPVNAELLDALRFARAFIGDDEPIITKRLDDAITGAESTTAQPDVVSALVAALRKIRDYQTFSPVGVAKDALAAFEAQSKAEPKA